MVIVVEIAWNTACDYCFCGVIKVMIDSLLYFLGLVLINFFQNLTYIIQKSNNIYA